jgi:hypothetical protein
MSFLVARWSVYVMDPAHAPARIDTALRFRGAS